MEKARFHTPPQVQSIFCFYELSSMPLGYSFQQLFSHHNHLMKAEFSFATLQAHKGPKLILKQHRH